MEIALPGSASAYLGGPVDGCQLRAIKAARAGNEREKEDWSWYKPMPAFFHTGMAAFDCIAETHAGKPEAASRTYGARHIFRILERRRWYRYPASQATNLEVEGWLRFTCVISRLYVLIN